MAILAALQSAAVRLVGRRPATFFQSNQQLEIELCDFINEVAQDVAKYQDWQALVRVASIGGSDSVALPSDYDRMTIDADVQNAANWMWGYQHILDMNEYLFRKNSGWSPWPGGWIMYQDRIHFSPSPTGAAQFPYITKHWARPANGGADKPAFTEDTDSFLLPERLLTLGLVWRWRENKKLDFTGDQDAYAKALDEYGTKDGGSRVMRFGPRRRPLSTSVPWSGTVL